MGETEKKQTPSAALDFSSACETAGAEILSDTSEVKQSGGRP